MLKDYGWRYCPRCGGIGMGESTDSCDNPYCRYPHFFKIDPKWKINEIKSGEITATVKASDMAYTERERQWEEYCLPFRKEVVFTSPVFDPVLYDRFLIWYKERCIKINKAFYTDWHRRKHVCPFCYSSNIKKISPTIRKISVRIFKMKSQRLGKQWRCKKCHKFF